jgi:hypothetical protein
VLKCDCLLVVPSEPALPREKKRVVIPDKAEWERRRNELVRAAHQKSTTFSRYEGATVQVLSIDTLLPLLAKDMNGRSDPYFVVWLSGYGNGLALQTTACDKTLVPSWDLRDGRGGSHFTFPLNNANLALLRKGKLAVHIEVWDKDVAYDDL